ncbi:MAG: phosphate transport system substrate-binding protein [Francisellaceae bacterium]|jgi:phosphate transport system substrate-binding protein
MKKWIKSSITLASVAIVTLGLVACGDNNSNKESDTGKVENIMGAGSSFIYPVMSRWINQYYNNTKIQVNYQPIGSGGGQRQIFKGTVNFAASDQPLTPTQLKEHKLIQFPAIVGGIVPVINIKGVDNNKLVLSGKVLSEIYLGKIINWDNKQIQILNPDIKLPHSMILTIHRADGSGTTYNFSNYLAKVNPTWETEVGVNTTLKWPGNGVGAKGNAGVAAQVKSLPNSIGYVEYAYAKEGHMTTIKMINADGKAVAPSLDTFKAAASDAKWKPSEDYELILTNQPGTNSWPINATTFILLPKNNPKNMNQAILSFFTWNYTEPAAKIAKNMDYIAIPQNVITGIKAYWKKNLGYGA